MAIFSLSARALLLAVLLTTGVTGNPIGLASSDSISICDTVKCTADTICKVIDGKAQCVPKPIECGKAVCEPGTTCCNPSCGLCVKPGMACTAHICPPIIVEPPCWTTSNWGKLVQCGPNVCKAGLECCNESCGICVEPGKGCTMQFCGGEQCGKTVCAAGLVCCNSSCGICAPPNGACTMQFCADGV
ncbi:hypothetical protein C8A00DRAFT_17995 [Chaetomidium leptoderma]|uniref:Uncharacterized protein n=1 Tax=Chaetomidium leptoderma TaxID=669021 RepID=A0AAN6VFE0_9PEZI|nr:hypothetical protein C8A00DRAFT_17995 [Chaetomidium leptoderma]